MIIEESKRLKSLPPYLFAEIDKIIQTKKSQGIDIISLGIGDPDLPTPESIINKLFEEAKNPKNHQYPSSYGLMELKEKIAQFYKKRFDVNLNPESEIIPLMGSKEGIANIAYAFIDPGDIALIPDPSYLVYKIGSMFAGGMPHMLPLEEKNDYLIDLSQIKSNIAKKSKIFYLNYPGNPTSANCTRSFFEDIVNFSDKYNIIVCHDNAYSDIYFDEMDKPISFLNAAGSKELGIEFNSLSKTFNMTGWRIGYAVGNKHIIKGLGKYKTNVDSGIFNAIQYAAIEALDNYDLYCKNNNKIYKERRELIAGKLNYLGIDYYKSNSTIYIWAKVPKGHSSESFAKLLLDRANVVVTPGSSFGEKGEGYFRISLTISNSRIEEALSRIEKVL